MGEIPLRVRLYEGLLRLWPHRVFVNVPTGSMVSYLGVDYKAVWRGLLYLEAQGVVQGRHSPRYNRLLWRPGIFSSAVYRTLVENWRKSRQYIPTMTLSVQLGKHERMIQDELVLFERAGVVERRGERGGWKPIRSAPEAAGVVLLDVVEGMYREQRDYLPTVEIAARLGVTDRHTRRLLANVEQYGVVERRGERGGWKPM